RTYLSQDWWLIGRGVQDFVTQPALHSEFLPELHNETVSKTTNKDRVLAALAENLGFVWFPAPIW
ncbi:hypothetical protein ACQP3F_31715, partial [Escherichia coli]